MANTIKDEIRDYLSDKVINDEEGLIINNEFIVNEICEIIQSNLNDFIDRQLT